MFRQAFVRLTQQASQYALPTAGTAAGLFGSHHFMTNINATYRQPAHAFWFGGNTPESGQNVQNVQNGEIVPAIGSGALAMPNSIQVLENAIQNPKNFHNATTPIDKIFLKENVQSLIAGTDISLEELRVRMDKYTERELKDSLSNGHSRAWLQQAIADIQRDRLLQSHKQSPQAYQRLQGSMLHTEIIPVSKGVIEEIHICQYQANKQMEDSYCFVKDLHSTNGSVIGVFDGHSGVDSSLYCAKNLVPYLDFFKYYGLSQDFMDPNVIQIADDHYIDLAIGSSAYKALTGACLLLTHITNKTLSTLWAGDCRALLVRDNTTKYTGPLPQQHPLHSDFSQPPIITHTLPVDGTVSGYQGDFTELTVPHQIDLNYYEKQRLINEHPGEPDVIARDRVKGGLQPTRAFGDAHYKKMSYFRLKYPNRNADEWFPPYITAKPDHSSYRLTTNDRYIVLCSDGLLDALTPQEVTSILHTSASTMPVTKINNVATLLTAQALFQAGKRVMGNAASHDDISNFFPRLPPGKERRRLHDDITVLVVKLNSDHIGNNKSDMTFLPPEMKPVVPKTLREAIKNGLLSSDQTRGGEFLNTGISIDVDPSKANATPVNFSQNDQKWAEFKM
jgi:serine/threonine protein phosphatase PrpC